MFATLTLSSNPPHHCQHLTHPSGVSGPLCLLQTISPSPSIHLDFASSPFEHTEWKTWMSTTLHLTQHTTLPTTTTTTTNPPNLSDLTICDWEFQSLTKPPSYWSVRLQCVSVWRSGGVVVVVGWGERGGKPEHGVSSTQSCRKHH